MSRSYSAFACQRQSKTESDGASIPAQVNSRVTLLRRARLSNFRISLSHCWDLANTLCRDEENAMRDPISDVILGEYNPPNSIFYSFPCSKMHSADNNQSHIFCF